MAKRGDSLATITARINKRIKALRGRSVAGLVESGLLVQGRAQKRTPVEYGNLRASAYARKAAGDSAVVEIGFAAAYALRVHEDLEPTLAGQDRPSGLGVYWGPDGAGPRFLALALEESETDVLDIVRRRIEITE